MFLTPRALSFSSAGCRTIRWPRGLPPSYRAAPDPLPARLQPHAHPAVHRLRRGRRGCRELPSVPRGGGVPHGHRPAAGGLRLGHHRGDEDRGHLLRRAPGECAGGRLRRVCGTGTGEGSGPRACAHHARGIATWIGTRTSGRACQGNQLLSSSLPTSFVA